MHVHKLVHIYLAFTDPNPRVYDVQRDYNGACTHQPWPVMCAFACAPSALHELQEQLVPPMQQQLLTNMQQDDFSNVAHRHAEYLHHKLVEYLCNDLGSH